MISIPDRNDDSMAIVLTTALDVLDASQAGLDATLGHLGLVRSQLEMLLESVAEMEQAAERSAANLSQLRHRIREDFDQ